jgi:hypothetical protein
MLRKYLRLLTAVGFAALLCYPSAAFAQTAPSLGAAQGFAVLGGSTVTSTGGSVLNGDLGVSPGTAITGFPPGTVNGVTHAADAVAANARLDATSAYNNLVAQPCTTVYLPIQEIGGLTLTPGVYCFPSSAQITGTVTLNALGNPDGVFIFKVGSTVTTAPGSTVQLVNGAQAANVFWAVGSSATVDTTSIFVGNILAVASITVNNGAHLYGRAIAQAAVTLINDVVDATYVDTSAADAEAAAAAEAEAIAAAEAEAAEAEAAEAAAAEAADVAAAVIPGSITGAAAGVFPSGALLYGLPLSELTLGKGLHLSSDGTASGQIQIALDGTGVLGPQTITVEGEVWSGSFDTFGNPTFGGLATVDVGNGSAPLLSVPFIVKLTSTGGDWWSLALTLAQSVLPDLPIMEGSITVHPLPPQ